MVVRKMLAGVVVAVIAASGFAAVLTATDKRGKPAPQSEQDKRQGDKTDKAINAILANQRRILAVLDTMEDKTLPDQQKVLASIHHLADAIRFDQDLVLQQISGLELACTTPDLVPIPKSNGDFCRLKAGDAGILQVPVYNQGGGPAGDSITSVFFRVPVDAANPTGVVQVDVATPPLGGFSGSGLLDFPIPGLCYGIDNVCMFKIAVDAGLGALHVVESNELNNNAAGQCFGVIL